MIRDVKSRSECSRRRGQRSGFSLAGTVTMIITVSFLLSLASTVLYQSFHAHENALEHVQNVQSLQQIAGAFRRDAQAAIGYDSKEEFVFRLSDTRAVSYAATEQGLQRSLRIDDQLVGQDLWKLPVKCGAKWLIDTSSQPTVTLSLVSSDEESMPSVQWVSRLGTARPGAMQPGNRQLKNEGTDPELKEQSDASANREQEAAE